MLKSNFNLGDTIAAISTPLGQAGISIVRLSGEDALKIADKLFISKGNKRPSEFGSYSIHYGLIGEPVSGKKSTEKRKVIDEVLLAVMRSPRSYTREDVVEINCHGGIRPTQEILELTLKVGARLAEPGEFTKRAFLNGRIDLAQAEAVLDIINAKTDTSLKIAVSHLKGNLSKELERIRLEITDILSLVETSIDFSGSEIEPIDETTFEKRLKKILKELKKLLMTSDRGIILNDGLSVVICGKPNVGKSSLMNALIRKEKVIVTPIAGTTRDAIEEVINLEGIPLKLIDTAGVLEAKDIVTKESVTRSKSYLQLADLAILVLDNSTPLTKEDKDLIMHLKTKKIIVVINKIDLPSRININRAKSFLENKKIIKISALKGTNLDKLEKSITGSILKGKSVSSNQLVINNLRHKTAIENAYHALKKSLKAQMGDSSIEFIAEYLKEAIRSLDRVAGQTTPDDILDRIFSKFCIGK